MTVLSSSFHYRPEIDGLRALAVIAVILFHAGLGCSGGYIGVDVFFVISGYLITSLICKDLDNGCFSFRAFWERRARRIAPALIVVTATTFVVGCVLLLPTDLKSLGRATASQALFAANVYYWLDSGYFSTTADEKPLLHTWSLAVEEQFYIIVPLLFWALFRTTMFRNRRAILCVIAVGIVTSLSVSIYGVAHHPSAAFYLLPTRAWELLFGSLIAVLPVDSPFLEGRYRREIFATTGMTLILVPAFVYTKETSFPGLAAVAPCCGTALIIWANGSKQQTVPTTIGAMLALPPVVFIGAISYSLYLWHWPFLAYNRYLSPVPLSFIQVATALGFGLIFAVFSWRFVETPFRTRTLGRTSRAMFAFAGAGLAGIFACGLLVDGLQGLPQRYESTVLEFANSKGDRPHFDELSIEDVRADRLIHLGVTDSALSPSVFVWGDSHAMAALPAVDALLREKGLVGCAAVHSDTPPVLNWYKTTKFNFGGASVQFNENAFESIKKLGVPDVLLICYWTRYREVDGHYSDAFNRSLIETVRRLVSIGSRPWVLMDVPVHSFDIPKALTSFTVSSEDIASLCTRPTSANAFDGIDPKCIVQIEAEGGRILDPKPGFLDPTGVYYAIQSNGISLYHDDNHLTTKGARLILVPFLQNALRLQDY